jgi:preprotein translocase subunit SecG
MYIFLVVLHVLVSIVLIGVVLLQSGKGAEMGAAFGGSSQTLFGGRGAATFLSKVTVGAAALFMMTSLGLSVLSHEQSVASSIMEAPKAEEATIPKQTGTPGGPNELPEAKGGAPSEAPSTPPSQTPSPENPSGPSPSGSGQR